MPAKPAKKKVAMVQAPPVRVPPPTRPAKKPDLEEVLHQLGNDRPFTLVATAVDHWIVHFSGDYKPSMITQVGGKWKILQAK